MSTLNKLDFLAKHGKEIPDEVYHKAIDDVLSDPDGYHYYAAKHPKLSKDNIQKIINHENSAAAEGFLHFSNKIELHHLYQLDKHPHEYVRVLAGHIRKLI